MEKSFGGLWAQPEAAIRKEARVYAPSGRLPKGSDYMSAIAGAASYGFSIGKKVVYITRKAM